MTAFIILIISGRSYSKQPLRANYKSDTNRWFDDVVDVIAKNLADLSDGRHINEWAKWVWFARRFRKASQKQNPKLLEALEMSPERIPAP